MKLNKYQIIKAKRLLKQKIQFKEVAESLGVKPYKLRYWLYSNFREAVKNKCKQWRKINNPKNDKAYKLKWNIDNKDRIREYNQKRYKSRPKTNKL